MGKSVRIKKSDGKEMCVSVGEENHLIEARGRISGERENTKRRKGLKVSAKRGKVML